MTNSTALVTTNQNHDQDDFLEIFSDLPPIEPFDVKKDFLGAQMAALMTFSGKSRADLVSDLGWKKSRISSVLSGKCNLTIKTIWEFTSYFGLDFDVIFRTSDEQRPNQPWQKSVEKISVKVARRQISDEFSKMPTIPVIEIQTANEVAKDLLTGNHKSYYFSVSITNENDSIPLTLEASPQANSFFMDFPKIQYLPTSKE